jgi:hypothetical protein
MYQFIKSLQEANKRLANTRKVNFDKEESTGNQLKLF